MASFEILIHMKIKKTNKKKHMNIMSPYEDASIKSSGYMDIT